MHASVCARMCVSLEPQVHGDDAFVLADQMLARMEDLVSNTAAATHPDTHTCTGESTARAQRRESQRQGCSRVFCCTRERMPVPHQSHTIFCTADTNTDAAMGMRCTLCRAGSRLQAPASPTTTSGSCSARHGAPLGTCRRPRSREAHAWLDVADGWQEAQG